MAEATGIGRPSAAWHFGAGQPQEDALRARGDFQLTKDGPAELSGSGWIESDRGFTDSGAQTLAVRARVDRPGGLLHTSALALLIHNDGLAMAFVGQRHGHRRFYRDIPLGPVSAGEWHDLALRCHGGQLDFICDGVVLRSVVLAHDLCPVLPGPTIIGGWRVDDPPLPDFPQWIVDAVFRRLFTGAIEYAAVWESGLTDDQLSELHGVSGIEVAPRHSEWHRCLDAYSQFADASERLDEGACRALGARMRRTMTADPRRPIYHLTAPMGWIADPAGAIYHDGRYHVFSYRNILGCLAFTDLDHYVSDDLVHWRDMPVAAWADSDADVHGIWLANHVVDDGVPTTLYTAHGNQGKVGVLARSRDGMTSFGEKRVVMTDPIHHDGHTWRSGDTWYTVTTQQWWGTDPTGGDAVLLLRSDDLVDWTLVGEVFRVPPYANPADDLQRWAFTEFPYLVPFGDRHALMLGTRPVTYWVGRFDEADGRFTPDEEEPKLLDYLNPVHCCNPSTVDARGPGGSRRRVMHAMLAHATGHVAGLPWKGALVLPRVLTRVGTRLLQQPVPEVEGLRGAHRAVASRRIDPGTHGHLEGLTGDTLEIVARFAAADRGRFGLRVRVSADGEHDTRIYYDASSGRFGVEGDLTSTPYPEQGSGPAYLKRGDDVELRVFLDRALLEAFVNGHTASGVFTAEPEWRGLDLFSDGSPAQLLSLDLWEMHSAW